MAVGSFMNKTFTVSDRKIFTPTNLTGNVGAEYASHARAGLKETSQYLSPKPWTGSTEILLRAQDNVKPRVMADYFIRMCEQGKADYFIIGSKPVCQNRVVITDVTEDWQEVVLNGVLIVCKLTLQLKEYL